MQGAGFEPGRGLHVHGHQFAAGRDVEKLLAIAPPSRLRTAAARDLELACARRERLHINIVAVSRLVGGVGLPTAGPRRKLALRRTFWGVNTMVTAAGAGCRGPGAG